MNTVSIYYHEDMDGITAGTIAKKYGGGGHKFASGFDMPINEFFDKIYKTELSK